MLPSPNRGRLKIFERELFAACYVLMLFLYLLPVLLSDFLPFSDLPGHLGVLGALIHRHEPEARIGQYFFLNPHFSPNCLEFGFTWAFAHLLGLTASARLFAGICVLMLPLSFLYLLKVLGKSRWLSFLALPFAYPRIMWFGFMGSSLGVGLLFLTVGLAVRSVQKRSLLHPALTAAGLVASFMAHPFFGVITSCVVLLIFLLSLFEHPFRWRAFWGLAAFLPSILVFHGWFTSMMGGRASTALSKKAAFLPSATRLLNHLLSRRPALQVYRKWMFEWSLHGFKDRRLEETLLDAVAVTLGVLVVIGVILYLTRRAGLLARSGIDGAGRRLVGWFLDLRRNLVYRVLPVGMFGLLLFFYLLLPGSIQQPVDWWAVAQRLVTPVILSAILLVPRSVPRWLTAIAVSAVLLISAVYGLRLAFDFRNHFNGKEMTGLSTALARIPPGKRVLGLYDDREEHYAHFPLHFGAAYYVALRGGMALPFPVTPGYKKIAWAYPRKLTPGPIWGKISHFNFRRHGRYYDYFLIKRHAVFTTAWKRFPPRCASVVGHFGLWTVVKRETGPGC